MNLWADKLLRTQPRQPDRLSCGASSAVMARALHDEGYARSLVDGATGRSFRDEVLSAHRRLTGPLGVGGRLQVPWPRSLGTPPWAVARALSALGSWHLVGWARRPTSRAALYERIERAVTQGSPVALYVGNRRLPRHVVLVLPCATGSGSMSCYEPSRGRVVVFARAAFIAGDLDLGGWSVPWFVVLPSSPA